MGAYKKKGMVYFRYGNVQTHMCAKNLERVKHESKKET